MDPVDPGPAGRHGREPGWIGPAGVTPAAAPATAATTTSSLSACAASGGTPASQLRRRATGIDGIIERAVRCGAARATTTSAATSAAGTATTTTAATGGRHRRNVGISAVLHEQLHRG